MVATVLPAFGLAQDEYRFRVFGNGLIHSTWLIESNDQEEKFILQKINHYVFKTPGDIASNIRLVENYLKQFHPNYLFVAPVKTKMGEDLLDTGEEYYRLFPFVKGSHTIDTVQEPLQAFEAAKQFARFTAFTTGLDINSLKITVPAFHDLSLRYQQFENALLNGNRERISGSNELIRFLQLHRNIAGEFEYEKADFKIRVTHHDTKISNVLFDEQDKGICIIDLDTMMPGYFISDMGDMMRTYLSPVDEEEKDLSKIEIRPLFYKAIVEGYLSEMGRELTDFEKKYFHFSGKFMTYMQAIRFLTDYISNDVYYGSKYEGHNFIRAQNQCTLLERLMEFESLAKKLF